MNLTYPGSDTLTPNPLHPPGSQPLERGEPLVKADALAYLLWEVKDLATQRVFLTDFGMLAVSDTDADLLMRGYGPEPYIYVASKGKKDRFLGGGFTLSSREDLETLAHATGQAIQTLMRPGGGEMVQLQDPNGLVVEVCAGIESVPPLPTRRDPLPVNTPQDKVRVNQGQRPELVPAPVLGLGHLVTAANNMREVCEWYMTHLGLIPTDVLCSPDGAPMIAFMRLDRGDKPADHHSFVVGKGGGKGYLHSAYEVVDVDAIGQGQQFLKAKGYNHVWGIGRHILGSQLFDYWHDPAGHEFEHYADGDVFTAEHPTQYHPMDPGNIYAWGQDMPKSMLAPSPSQLLSILRGLFDGSVTLQWLKGIMQITKRAPRPWL
ncbi:MAG: VOC family protein [Pseudomonadota bacterium]